MSENDQDMLPNARRFSPGSLALRAVVALICAFLIIPTLIVIPMSFGTASYIEFPPSGMTLRWFSTFFEDSDWVGALLFSAQVALGTTISATIIGTLASVALVRGDLPGKEFVQALTLSPLIVPHIVVGVALFLVFAPLRLTGNFVGFLIAHTMLAVPYVVLTVSASLQRFDVTLELAALSCGAGRIRTFFSIVLPNILPSVAAGAVFAFLSSFDEATVAFFISDVGGKTITRKMFEDIDYNLTPVVAAASTMLVVASLLLMGLVQLLQRRSSR